MTCPDEISTFYDVLKLLTADGFNGLGEAVRRLINEAMRLERQEHLGVGRTNVVRIAKVTPMAINPRRSRHGLVS